MNLNSEEARRLHALTLIERRWITSAQAADNAVRVEDVARQRVAGPHQGNSACAEANVVQCLDGA